MTKVTDEDYEASASIVESLGEFANPGVTTIGTLTAREWVAEGHAVGRKKERRERDKESVQHAKDLLATLKESHAWKAESLMLREGMAKIAEHLGWANVRHANGDLQLPCGEDIVTALTEREGKNEIPKSD